MQRLLILFALCLASLLLSAEGAAGERADAAAPDPDPAASPPSPGSDPDAIRYRVDIVAPAELRDLLAPNLDLVRWQSHGDMTVELLDLLVRDAVPQAREAAATLGYFNPTVDVNVDRAQQPWIVTLAVEPGAATRVAEVAIDVSGPAAHDAAGREAIAGLTAEWALPRGSVWRQAAWSDAKQRAVAALTAGPWAAARITRSESRIDRGTDTAALSVDIDSGPAFHYGDIDVRGLSRYPPSIVENFSTLEPGAPYRAADLDQLARRLAGSGYFSSVQAAIDPEPATAERAPVQVAVIEGRTKKLEGGVGFSTDTNFRANASYSDVDVDGHALQFYADGRLEQKLQLASLRFVRPPTPSHWRDTLAAAWLRTDIENLITSTGSVTVRRVGVEERDQPGFGAGYFIDEQRPSEAPVVSSHALFVDATRTWRRVDDLLSPTRGWILDLGVGGGIPGVSTRGFGRVLARAGAWWPLAPTWDLSARAIAGAVLAPSRDGIPSTFLFRTGGDTTVRGYAFESIGVPSGTATVPGRYELVASAEITKWVTTAWGIAAFVDAGNATDTASDVAQLKLGYGLGGRIRTPIGPFRLDVAYGQENHSVRIHFSIGLSF